MILPQPPELVDYRPFYQARLGQEDLELKSAWAARETLSTYPSDPTRSPVRQCWVSVVSVPACGRPGALATCTSGDVWYHLSA